MGLAKAYSWIRSTADFKSVATGNWNNYATWQIKGVDGLWYDSPYVPEKGNNVFLQAAFTVTLTADAECKDIWLNTTQDVIRINTGVFSLKFYGTMAGFTGAAPGTIDGANAGIAGWITGKLSPRGLTRTIWSSTSLSANSRSAGWTLDFALDAGQTGTCAKTIRCGHLIVSSGILSTGIEEIRPAGEDYTAQPGNGVSGGTVLIKSGATYKAATTHKNNVSSAGNSVASFTIESGGIVIPNFTGVKIASLANSLLGTVDFDIAGAQVFLQKDVPADAVDITTYGTVKLSTSGAKTLVVNTIINTRLVMGGTATLDKSTFSLSYGTSADLEYTTSRVKGTELIASGSGVSIPRNLILAADIVLDLGAAIVNIRGTLTLGSGASVINGTLNQNQP